MAGLPLVQIGRTTNITWGVTAAVTDTSDLYKEKISEDGNQYKLDGEWKDLKVEPHKIKVKGRDEPEIFDLKYTHRGPVISSNLMSNAVVLFGSKIPIHEATGNYSLAWSGHQPGESFLELI